MANIVTSHEELKTRYERDIARAKAEVLRSWIFDGTVRWDFDDYSDETVDELYIAATTLQRALNQIDAIFEVYKEQLK